MESCDKPRQCIKKQRHHFANTGVDSWNSSSSSSHVRMWELDHKEGWVLKNWCFWIVVLEKTLERPLDSKEIKTVNPKGNQPWIFIGKTVAEAEAPKTDSLEKTLMLGEIEGKRRRGQQKMRWLDGITNSADLSLSKLQEIVEVRKAWRAVVHRVTKNQTWLSDWTKTNTILNSIAQSFWQLWPHD